MPSQPGSLASSWMVLRIFKRMKTFPFLEEERSMVLSESNLRKRLNQLSQKELIDLITLLYQYYPDVQSPINQAAVTKDSPDDVLSHMEDYSPGECKIALTAHIKTIKDKKERVLYYYDFIEWILDRKDTIDFRFISVASATYGKAMDILEKNKDIWDELLERTYAIATRFYEMNGAVVYKAVEYYMRVKRGYDRQ